jgi:hypothetical protein
MRIRKQLHIALAGALTTHLALAAASDAPIGLIIQNGEFRVDSATVRGNATLFAGKIVETGPGLARAYLNNGAKVQLAAESRARIFPDRLVLESGASGVSGTRYRVDARSLRIETESPEAAARVRLAGAGSVQVAAVQGPVSVRNRQGVLLARVPAGRALEFHPEAAPPATMQATGVLRQVEGRFLVEDPATGIKMELHGQGLEKAAGKRVRVTGTARADQRAPDGAHVVDVVTLEVLDSRAKPAAALWGMSTTTAIVVLGTGVTVAAVSAGVALGGDDASSGGQDGLPSLSPASR